jgi:hypothetical protein
MIDIFYMKYMNSINTLPENLNDYYLTYSTDDMFQILKSVNGKFPPTVTHWQILPAPMMKIELTAGLI